MRLGRLSTGGGDMPRSAHYLSGRPARSATGKRAAVLQEYVAYIERVTPGEAGKLEAGEGETTQAIWRRLNAAAAALGKNLEFRRTASAVYFWPSESQRRGRPRKTRSGAGHVADCSSSTSPASAHRPQGR